jgi:peptidyl-prolyl cis-trans isomerase C
MIMPRLVIPLIEAKCRFSAVYLALCLCIFLSFNKDVRAVDLKRDSIVAIVDGFKIYQSDVENARKRLSPEAQKYSLATVYKLLLDDIVNMQLIVADARKQGLNKRDEVVNKIRQVEMQILYQTYLGKHISASLTDEKLEKSYQTYLESMSVGKEIRARHILVQTREQALEVIDRLNKGENFATLAKLVSTGPSGKQGGDLGYFTQERMVPTFSAAAFETSVGKFTTKPVKTQFGWHVIKVEDARIQMPKSFGEVKAQLRQELTKNLTKEIITGLRNTADIKIFGLNEK